jgi:hypothetical protein
MLCWRLQVLTQHLAPNTDTELGDGDGAAGRGVDAATAALTAQVSELATGLRPIICEAGT